jgi:hypothetical protein
VLLAALSRSADFAAIVLLSLFFSALHLAAIVAAAPAGNPPRQPCNA